MTSSSQDLEIELQDTKQDMEIQLQEMKDDYELKIRELTPRVFGRDWFNHGKWPNWTVQLLVELLPHCTPPSCIRANIMSFTSLTNPINKDLIQDIPGVSFIRECLPLLVVITKSLAARHVAGLESFDQLCTDGTDVRQTEFENVVVGYMSES